MSTAQGASGLQVSVNNPGPPGPPGTPGAPGGTVLFGSSLTSLVAGDNIIVPASGVSRAVSLFSQYNLAQVMNADNISHDLVYKVGGNVISNVFTLGAGSYSTPSADNFGNLNAFVLAPGETLVLNVSTPVNIAGSLISSFCWIDSPVFGVTRRDIPDLTPVTIIPAPPGGTGRRSQLNDEFMFSTGGYFYNGNVGAVNVTVVIDDGVNTSSNIAGINVSQVSPSPTIIQPGGFGAYLSAGLTSTQSLVAFLDSTPAIPLKFFGVYKDFPIAV